VPAMPDRASSRFLLPRARGDPRVEAELRRRIRAHGPITFAEFMDVALYLLDAGYYEAHVELGRSGDFLTSPETHPVFGALLARLALLMWRTLDSPRTFHIVEYGAGTGSLCRQLLEAAPRLDAQFASALRYQIVERSAFLRALQQAKLLDLVDRVIWVHPEQQPEPVVGCVIANEVADALPVHRLCVTDGELREVYVGVVADRFIDLRGPFSRPELARYLSDEGVAPPEGSTVEISLAARDWLQDVSRRLARGYHVTLDFGGEASAIYGSATPRGGLKCFHRHGWTDDPLDRPGLLDITAPVDCTNLKRIGAELGLALASDTSQSEVLLSLGLGAALERLERLGLPSQERQKNRIAMKALADPRGLGAYRVLIQARAASAFAFESEPLRGGWHALLPEEVPEWPR